ncbi:MAG TPA: DUF2062 domain-containing protein [Noviherbaspirillum sp.]|nr:DUF2062 domain-containing protein [Noviherbaspirillum sp.]
MPRGQFSKRLPSAQSLKQSRFLKPFAPYLDHHFLWQFNRRSVAGGVAVGLFFGLLIPFAQIFFAALVAIIIRVNLPTAAFCTLVSNPLTFPAIYYAAYRLGDFLTGAEVEMAEAAIETDIQEVLTVQQGEVIGWFPNLLLWLQSVGLPLALGLLVMSTVGALAGYFLVSTIWKMNVSRRWRQRRDRM